jgi:hypothetical protein
VVEGTGFENRQARKGLKGSNPFLSAGRCIIVAMRNTTIFEKLVPTLINCAIVFGLSTFFLNFPYAIWATITVFLFLAYNLFFLVFNKNICLGMMLMGTRWKRRVSFQNELLYVFLYTLSFSTIFIKIWFPFDVLLINLIFLQLPTILFLGTTLHGYLSGYKTSTVKK